MRHPFFDLRLLNFLLALPAIPWCSDKELLRQSMRGILPPKVRLRRKSPLMADPLLVLLRKPESAWVDRFEPAPDLSAMLSVAVFLPSTVNGMFGTAWINLRPLSLNFWLRRALPLG